MNVSYYGCVRDNTYIGFVCGWVVVLVYAVEIVVESC